nr:transposase [Halomicronema sp. CCY15110]
MLPFLDDPEVDAMNNLAEQQLRPAIINRKLYCGNPPPAGANPRSALVSLAATCHHRLGDSFIEQVAELVLKNRAA